MLITNAIVDFEHAAHIERVVEDIDFARFRVVKPDCFAISISLQVAKEILFSLKYFRFVSLLLTSGSSTERHTLCEYCGTLFTDYLSHYIMGCTFLVVERDKFWDFIINYFPVQVSAKLHNLEDWDTVNCLLGGPCDIDFESYNMYCMFQYRCALFLYSLKDTIEPLMLANSWG